MDSAEEKTKELLSQKTKVIFFQNTENEGNMQKKMTESDFFSAKQKSILTKNTFIADWQVYEKVANEANK